MGVLITMLLNIRVAIYNVFNLLQARRCSIHEAHLRMFDFFLQMSCY